MQAYGLTTLGQRNHGCLKCYHMTICVVSKVTLPWLRQGSKRQIDWLFSMDEIMALKSNRGGLNFIFYWKKTAEANPFRSNKISPAVKNSSYVKLEWWTTLMWKSLAIIQKKRDVPTECAHKDTLCYIYFTKLAVINHCLDSLRKVEMCQTLWCGKKAIVL